MSSERGAFLVARVLGDWDAWNGGSRQAGSPV